MNNQRNRRMRQLFANTMHRQIFLVVFMAALVPTIITALGIFYLTFTLTAEQLIFPEMIARNLFPAAEKTIMILSIVTPIVITLILVFAYKVTHRIVGPYDRILRELGEIIDGVKQDKIVLRSKDQFSPLVDKINQLAEKARAH